MTNKYVDPNTLPYRKCVGIVVLNQAGKVWAGKRKTKKNDELEGSNKLWQFPQGGIDEGEKPLDAAKRELYEETGITAVTLLKETQDWYQYDLPKELVGIALKGKYRGQTQKWFAFRFNGNESQIAINPPPNGNTAEFDEWCWVDLEEMAMMVVPFKQAVYEHVISQFRHIIVD